MKTSSAQIRNTTQTAVINIFKIRILLNLTFRMFVHIHFQKNNSYGFWEAIYMSMSVVKSFCFIRKAVLLSFVQTVSV